MFSKLFMNAGAAPAGMYSAPEMYVPAPMYGPAPVVPVVSFPAARPQYPLPRPLFVEKRFNVGHVKQYLVSKRFFRRKKRFEIGY